jgi:hypothetical protein
MAGNRSVAVQRDLESSIVENRTSNHLWSGFSPTGDQQILIKSVDSDSSSVGHLPVLGQNTILL